MKKPNHLLPILVMCVVLISVVACGGGKTGDSNHERDSLEQANRLLMSSISFITSTLDSIAVQENQLMVFSNDGVEVVDQRTIIKQRLATLSELLKSQKEQLAKLNERLEGKGGEMTDLKRLLAQVNEQLEQKSAEVERLTEALQDSRKSIAELRENVQTLNIQNANQKEMLAEQQEALSTQDKIMNEGYFLVGTTQELQAAGIVTNGGFLKKKKVNLSAIRQDGFQVVDIREFATLPIHGKKVKLLTPAPKGSYTLSPNGDGWLLTITDAASFWSVSNYLVIKAD